MSLTVFVAFLCFALHNVHANDDMNSCLVFLDPEREECCETLKNFKDTSVTQCEITDWGEKDLICKMKEDGVWDEDKGEVDLQKMEEFMKKSELTHPGMSTITPSVVELCHPEYKDMPPEDGSLAVKYGLCFVLASNIGCSDFAKTEKCQKMKEASESCKRFIKAERTKS